MKKIVIGVTATVVIAAAVYFGLGLGGARGPLSTAAADESKPTVAAVEASS